MSATGRKAKIWKHGQRREEEGITETERGLAVIRTIKMEIQQSRIRKRPDFKLRK